jgi:hypothetical protein
VIARDSPPGSPGTRPETGKTIAFGLLKRTVIVLPSWKGVVLIIGLLAILAFAAVTQLHPFLAPYDPRPGEILVIEGWAADYAFEEAVEEYRKGSYRALYVTGGPIEKGAPLSEWKTLADLGAATIHKMHPELPNVIPVASEDVERNRTYASAVALRDYLRARNQSPSRVNLISVSVHARRSRMLFQEAFGPKVDVGVVAVRDREYDPKRWWASSSGFRSVVAELIAYGYARLLFRPDGA